jgi:predicted ATPase
MVISEESTPGSFRGYLDALVRSGITIFDLDPKLPKKAAQISGRAQLDADGGNLALVLRNLLQDQEKRAVFVRILRDVLPFIEDLSVENFLDKSLLVAAKERFSTQALPAPFLSDGTIHLTALILALYFHDAAVTIVEEPERNIHPHLISKVVRMLMDASQQKQIIVTTHNPELVKHADLADLLLVHRDEQGFSHVTRPAENAELKVFLENDLGVDELYVQNLLGVGHGV